MLQPQTLFPVEGLRSTKYQGQQRQTDGQLGTTDDAPSAVPLHHAPTVNREWFNYMREEREASDRRLMQMVEKLSEA